MGMDQEHEEIHIHLHFDGFGPTQPPQASLTGRDEMATESDQDREYRLMLKYTSHEETLTPEEFDFLKRRGAVRY